MHRLARFFSIALFVTLVITTWSASSPRASVSETAVPAFDLLITNGRIVDGSGNPWFRTDIGIKDGRIARLGRINPADARQTIDARGQIVAPGFIDVHTHIESIYSLPAAENFIRMGVTTLVTGNCGASAIDVAQFLGRIKEKPLTVNLATLIAHGSVVGRRWVRMTDHRHRTR